ASARVLAQSPRPRINVGEIERLASLAGGAGVLLAGIIRGRLSGIGMALAGAGLGFRGATGPCAPYEAIGIHTAHSADSQNLAPRKGARVEESVEIARPPEELYRWWRNLSNLPQVMTHLKSVRLCGDGRSHWVAEGPTGAEMEWDAEIIAERENELIGWRSVEHSDVDTAGSVQFIPQSDGEETEARVVLRYAPPAGIDGVAAAELFGESAADQIRNDLRRFKRRMEFAARHPLPAWRHLADLQHEPDARHEHEP